MFTTGSKWFFGVAGAALVAALVYGGATNPNEVGMSTFTGVLTLGYKGGVGDHVGYAILMGICGAALFLGSVSAAFRDADVEAEADLLGGPVPEVVSPDRGSYWPVIGAFGAGLVVLGIITNVVLAIFGAIVLVAVTFEWAISAWADMATTDPDVNRAVRRRVMLPIEVPVLGALGVGVFVLAVSRILIAVESKLVVYILFGGVALGVLIIASLLSVRTRINPNVVAALCLVGGLLVIGGGVVSAIVGPREIEPHHGEEHSGEEGEEHEGAPLLPSDSPSTPVGEAS